MDDPYISLLATILLFLEARHELQELIHFQQMLAKQTNCPASFEKNYLSLWLVLMGLDGG